MGPIALFDKSFLQSLSLDLSVWFDHFFLTNVSPIFYVETLADLGKKTSRRSPEEEVRIIADKFPQLGSGPCAHHLDLAHANLMGQEIPNTGQIPISHGRLVEVEGELISVSDKNPVAEAFSRWQKSEFEEVERLYAKSWRDSLLGIDLSQRNELYAYLGIDISKVRSLEAARDEAIAAFKSKSKPYLKLEYLFTSLGIPTGYQAEIRSRWAGCGFPSISDFAPYASFIVSIDLFAEISLDKGLIAAGRQSNRIDLAYLYYLPFCMVFVSSDRLHRRTTPLFLRDNQEFVWGIDLRDSLEELDLFFSLYPKDEIERGLQAFAPTPPKHIDTLVSDLWDRHLPSWRMPREARKPKPEDIGSDIRIRAEKAGEAPPLNPEFGEHKPTDVDAAIIHRRVSKKKGKWYQVPKDIEASDC